MVSKKAVLSIKTSLTLKSFLFRNKANNSNK